MCPTLTVGSFLRRVRSTFLSIYSTTSTRTTDVHNILETPENVQNKNIDVPNLENRKHTKDPLFDVFFTPIFFSTMRLEIFWIAPKGLPFVCFDILQQKGCQKIPKGPPFTFFGTVTLLKNLNF